jgi:hypothetical protein
MHTLLNSAIFDALAERVERAPQWDADPVLFRVYVVGRVVTLAPIAVPPEQWRVFGGTAAGLEALAKVMILAGMTDREPTTRGNLHAVAFFHEGWTVHPEPSIDDHHAWRRIQKMAGDHRLRFHPDAVEIRNAIAVDRDGYTYQVQHKRGHVGTETRLMVPGHPDTQAAGVVVEALDAMIVQLTGCTLPPRPDATIQTSGDMN